MERLLALGANPDNGGNAIGMAPIHLASATCDKLLMLLIRGRANTERCDEEGQLVESAVLAAPQFVTPVAWAVGL